MVQVSEPFTNDSWMTNGSNNHVGPMFSRGPYPRVVGHLSEHLCLVSPTTLGVSDGGSGPSRLWDDGV